MNDQLKEFLLKLAKESTNEYSIKGYKNEALYMLCCELALLKYAEATNYGEKGWGKIYTIHTVAERFYEEFVKKGDLEWL